MQGEVEVQDEGSQLLALLLDAKRGEMVVDFCAGAGGKTLAIGAAMRNSGRLYAFDTSGHRLDALKPRLARSGLSNVHPVAIAHERDDRIKRLAGKIDRVLVDAPVFRPGHAAPQPRPEMAPDPANRRRPGRTAAGHPAQRGPPAQAGRAAGVRHLQPAARQENEAVAQAFAAAHPDFEAVPVAGLLGGLHKWGMRRNPVFRVKPVSGCVCGPIGMQQTASLPPSGGKSLENASNGLLLDQY